MYCKNCGKRLQNDSVFCDSCGVRIEPLNCGPAPATRCIMPCKSKGVAILCSLIIMGGGHLYADEVSKGIMLLLSGVLLSILMIGLILISEFVAAMIIAILFFCLIIYSILDSCKKVDEYNRRIRDGR